MDSVDMWDEEKVVPYQFTVSERVRDAVMEKAKKSGFKIAPLMKVHFEQFLERPVSESLEIIEKHNNKKEKKKK